MDDRPSTSCKRDEPEHKRQELSRPNDEHHNPAPAVEETKALSNIYYDCLERIFDFLDLESLLNVADTCKHLQVAAAVKFAYDFGDALVTMFPIGSTNRIENHACSKKIFVCGMTMCLSFLRCFGAQISKLSVFSGACMGYYEYINQYCADTLIAIDLRYDYSHTIFHGVFSKPFKRLQSVQLMGTNLNDHLLDYARWFPNVRDLNITDNTIERYKTDVHAVRFPHLKKFRFHFTYTNIIETKNIAGFLRANRQLKDLELRLNVEMTFQQFTDLVSEHRLLTKLKCLDEITYGNVHELNHFAGEHPQIEELILPNLEFDEDGALTMTRRLNALKRFEFEFEKQYHGDEYGRFLRKFDKKWQHRTIGIFRVTPHIKIELFN